MDQTSFNASSRPSHIPRPSKLPVPRANARSTGPLPLSSSSSTAEISRKARLPSSTSRLRATSSRDQLSSVQTPSPVRNSSREVSPRSGTYVTSRASPSSLRRNDFVNAPQEADAIAFDGLELRKTRPSLSQRAMETISQIPPSPVARRTGSSFFNPNSPMRPPSRRTDSQPGSSYQTDASMPPPLRPIGSRPSSSAGYEAEGTTIDLRSSVITNTSANTASASETPVKESASVLTQRGLFKAKSNADLRSKTSTPRLPSDSCANTSLEQSPSLGRSSGRYSTAKPGSQTISGKSLRPRASVGGLFRKPSSPEVKENTRVEGPLIGSKKTSPTFSTTSSEGFSVVSRASKESVTSTDSAETQIFNPKKSSLALRDQIAKAKAAKRAQVVRQSSGNLLVETAENVAIIPTATFDFDLANSPFGRQSIEDGGKGLLRKRIDSARTDGRLNIAGMGLKEIPSEVMNMYNLDAVDSSGTSWAESVDLIRFIAADNELSSIGDDIFPDIDPKEYLETDDDSSGNQFGGLETLDLHGNLLQALPLGLRRLQMLTTLNLSNNELGNDCFDVLSQMTSLRDLKLAHNNLSGELDARLTRLQNLEAIDVQQNHLESLPRGISELVRLRVLNLSRNHIASFSLDWFQDLPLTQLLITNNKISGHLSYAEDIELPHLQLLDVTSNTLTSLTSDRLRLPAIYQLSCSANRLTQLPDMSSWQSLLTLSANDNSISSIPEGFTCLPKLKTVDLTGNDLRQLDDRIGRMENLDTLNISGNPLREKKLSGMTTEDLKRTLRARLAPEESGPEAEPEGLVKDDTDTDTSFATATSSPVDTPSSTWPIKAGGILDRSHTHSHSLNPVIMAQMTKVDSVRMLELHHNSFKELPHSIALFAATLTMVNLTQNELAGDAFLTDHLDLPALKELNLSSNTISSVQPLIERLRASQLSKLDVSFNRLGSLPALRPHFPHLTTILASNNGIEELSPEAVEGLKVLDCSSNNLNSLNARLGLLGGTGGLERLDVRGNRFRVPNYSILDKGTEATLAWLRNRIPAEELNGAD
ncbi:MAG: hypothetical protein M1818_007586 [Claussenomyces sp. TS43310]|nr:MAG: hypothetical protein M1818_007586 [Claussenomyces sp. TS43310]